MTRRNFIALVSLCVLVALGLIVVGAGVFATQSSLGQTAVQHWVQSRIQSSINGRVHIGKISGSFLTGIAIDSLELRDDEDSLVVATGRIAVAYDPRDLVDRRLYLRRVDITHPSIVLRQHENWKWNYKKLFRLGGPQRKKIKGPERGFGDFVILDSVSIGRGATFRLTIPWHPDDSLSGARKDSAIRRNIARDDHEIRRTREGLTQTYRWTNAYAAISHIRIADPDSAGQVVTVDTLHADESTPPFMWRNIKASARVLGDSVWLTASRWDLAGSTGRAEGKVIWGSDLPVRYAMRVTADTASIADVAWVYPTLPTTGGGKLNLEIRNNPQNLHLLNYALSEIDVRTTKSHLLGSMRFEIGGPVLAVHDVKLRADRVDFDLLRTLNGKPFPADWQGKISGTVTARGGPLTNFYVDAANLTFSDAHVPGAVSHLQGRGELDILFPAFTAFHSFYVTTDRFDIRTLPAIYPAFPRLKGIVTGSAVLDSSWLDVRVSNASLAHTDGPAEPSRATGGGRITYGEKFMTYDMTLDVAPLSLATLAESYPKFPLRGSFSGPLKIRGEAPALDVTADLAGPAGHITYSGKVDADSVGGYGGKGTGLFEALDAAAVMGFAKPDMHLSGRYDADLLGDSLANLAGTLAVRLEPSEVDGVGIARADARLRFADGVLVVDTLGLSSVAGSLTAKGSVGLTRPQANDSLMFALTVDSLGGLRRYLITSRNSSEAVSTNDTLAGVVTVRGSLSGWLDSLQARAILEGSDLQLGTTRAEAVKGTIALRDVRKTVTGGASFQADTLFAGGLRFETATITTDVLDTKHAQFTIAAGSSASQLAGAGDWRLTGDTTAVRLDQLSLDIGSSAWRLREPSSFTLSPSGVWLDTLVFANNAGGSISGFIDAPSTEPARGRLLADSVSLADLGRLSELPSALSGLFSLDLGISGTRDLPILALSAAVRRLGYAGVSSELVSMTGNYGANRASVQASAYKNGRAILDGVISYPVALTLFSARTTGDSLRGRIYADSVELSLIEALSPQLRNTTGRLSLDLAVTGQPAHPHVGGRATLRDGVLEVPSVGVRFTEMDGSIEVDAARDSLHINNLRWTSPASGGAASVQGSLVFRDLANPRLDLRLDATNIRAVDKRGLARLDVSTGASGLTLAGTPEEATLSGAVDVVRGTIYIPDLVRKQVVDLTPEDFAQLFDTTDVRNRSLMPQPPSALVEHLRLDGVSIRVGEDVWLRSREASIKLGGSLNVTRARDSRESTRSTLSRTTTADSARYKLALAGTLSADRGTYTLDLTAVQREFQVESGRITFFGTSDFNPELDVSALYQLKQANRADIGIRARIHGNFFPQPALELSSTDAYLSPSDLVAYLVTGQPSSELSRQDLSASQRAMEFVLPTVGASVSRALREQLGGVVDLIQIQSGAVNDPIAGGTSSSQFRSILSSTRLGGEKQITNKLFLSFSTGLCQLGDATDDAGQQGLVGFANAIEGKLEYRFPLISPDRLSIRAGREPPASALRCGTGSVRGFVATPQQWGLSLFRSWSF